MLPQACISRCMTLMLLMAISLCARAQTEYEPAAQKARVVIVVSGASGAGNYGTAAGRIAQMGYDVFLVDGNAMIGGEGAALEAVIGKAQQSPHALPGKVAVVGFSLGGGVALGQATRWPDRVAGVIALYPLTSNIKHPDAYVARFAVPVLVLAGERDSYHNCCLIGTARAIAAAAAARKLPFELVTYPSADHDFVMAGRNYDGTAAPDAWDRTQAKLKALLGD